MRGDMAELNFPLEEYDDDEVLQVRYGTVRRYGAAVQEQQHTRTAVDMPPLPPLCAGSKP